MTTVTIKEYPLSKGNAAIEEYLKTNGINMTKKTEYGFMRSNSKELTDCYNGHIFVYIESDSLKEPLPRFVNLGAYTVKLFHDGQQIGPKERLCTNCFKTDHRRRQCQNPSACRVCKKPGHMAGDKTCSETHGTVTPFQKKDNIFSKMYECELCVFGIYAQTGEHAYNYVRATRQGQPTIASDILGVRTGWSAKDMSKPKSFFPVLMLKLL